MNGVRSDATSPSGVHMFLMELPSEGEQEEAVDFKDFAAHAASWEALPVAASQSQHERLAQWKSLAESKEAILALSTRSPTGYSVSTWRAAANWSLLKVLRGHACQYLEEFGFPARSDAEWRWPPVAGGVELDLRLEGRISAAGYTWYLIECALHAPTKRPRPFARRLEWPAPRTLAQLRAQLHDAVKLWMGEANYAAAFAGAPFARRGGPPGTTGRLRAWLERLAEVVSAGRAPPLVAALVLEFLAVPRPLMTPGRAAVAGRPKTRPPRRVL